MFFFIKEISYKGKKYYLYIDSENYYITEDIIHDDIDHSKIIKKGSILNAKKSILVV